MKINPEAYPIVKSISDTLVNYGEKHNLSFQLIDPYLVLRNHLSYKCNDYISLDFNITVQKTLPDDLGVICIQTGDRALTFKFLPSSTIKYFYD